MFEQILNDEIRKQQEIEKAWAQREEERKIIEEWKHAAKLADIARLARKETK